MSSIQFRVSDDTTAATFKADCVTGKVRAYRLRENGRFALIKFLAEGTPEREVAEWIRLQQDEGRTALSIAKEIFSSSSSVRRARLYLETTEEIEEMDLEDIQALLGEAQATADALDAPQAEQA